WLSEVSKPKKSVVKTALEGEALTTMRGARLFSGGNLALFALKSRLAVAKSRALGGALLKLRCANVSFDSHFMQSNVTTGLTITSPTSHVGPMPPAVPVVMTISGATSAMICCQTSSFGSVWPGLGAVFVSCDMCESDLK